ncbi:putative protein K02A2.6, partial [Mucuna pruriens]
MIAKSRTPYQHVEDLRKLFERLRKYKLRLNPAMCTFRVKIRKLLGFIVNERGIEMDLDKVKVIRNMPPPRTETEVRVFLGRVNYIASQKAIKGSTLVEQLAHHPLGDYQPLLHEFLDEHIMLVDEIGLMAELDEWKL